MKPHLQNWKLVVRPPTKSDDGFTTYHPAVIEPCGLCINRVGGITAEDLEALQLAAAAPDLLDALEECVQRMAELQEHTNYPLAWPRVKAMDAIKKARGEA